MGLYLASIVKHATFCNCLRLGLILLICAAEYISLKPTNRSSTKAMTIWHTELVLIGFLHEMAGSYICIFYHFFGSIAEYQHISDSLKPMWNKYEFVLTT